MLPRSAGDFRIGADTYRKKLQYDEMVDIPLDRLLEIGAHVLPGSGPGGDRAKLGRDSQSALAPSLLTATTEEAARRNNEIAPARA